MTTNLLICGLFFFTNAANAQTVKSLDCRACEQTAKMNNKLTLTALQNASTYTINMYVDGIFDKMVHDHCLHTNGNEWTFRELGIERNTLMEKVLTLQQYRLYLQNQKHRGFAIN